MGYQLTPGTTLENIDGSSVLITANNDVAVLNETAGFIVDALLNSDTSESVTKALSSSYAIDELKAEKDVAETLASLTAHGMIEKSEE